MVVFCRRKKKEKKSQENCKKVLTSGEGFGILTERLAKGHENGLMKREKALRDEKSA